MNRLLLELFIIVSWDLLIGPSLPHSRTFLFPDSPKAGQGQLLSMNIHAKVVSEILGHSQISLTLDTYSHVLPSLQEEAMNRLNILLSKDV
jgi:integrase